MRRSAWLWLSFAASVFLACSSEAPSAVRSGCVSGELVACECANGRGAATCSSEGVVGACQCFAAGGASGGPGGAGEDRSGAGGNPPGPGPAGGSPGVGGAGDSKPSYTVLKAFCEDTFTSLANRVRGCCGASEQYLEKDPLEWLDQLAQQCPAVLSLSVTQGRALYEAKTAEACRKAVHERILSAQCGDAGMVPRDALLWEEETCRGMLVGQQAENQPCAHSFECADGLDCLGQTEEVDGYCSRPRQLKESCGPASKQAPLLFPFGERPSCVQGAQCYLGVCVPVPSEGQGCDAKGAAGGAQWDCAEGLVCEGSQGQRVCVPEHMGKQNEACGHSSFCQQGLACQSSAKGKICAPPRAHGQPCEDDSNCQGRCQNQSCVSLCGRG